MKPQVYKIDVERNLIFVRGSVPGSKGGVVRVSDAITKAFPKDPPFPTCSLEDIDTLTEADLMMPARETNPWA